MRYVKDLIVLSIVDYNALESRKQKMSHPYKLLRGTETSKKLG